MEALDRQLAHAIRHFWTARDTQQRTQGARTGTRDYGSRSAVTGGKQLDGFARILRTLLIESGVEESDVYSRKGKTFLPGYYRPTKQWDLVVVSRGLLVATVEFKSIVGSFGNNMNNRTEEALGSAIDLWTAYREGKFAPAPTPWLGYLMLMEDCKSSTQTVRIAEPHFPVFEEWRGSSYSDRCEKLCKRLVRERLYQAAAFLVSDRETGPSGNYKEPSQELCFSNFVASLVAHATAFTRFRPKT